MRWGRETGSKPVSSHQSERAAKVWPLDGSGEPLAKASGKVKPVVTASITAFVPSTGPR